MADGEDSTAKQDVWRTRLDAWKASGLSMRRYCLKEGIGVNGLRYWRGKLGGSDGNPRVVRLPVRLAPAEPMIEVVMGNRFTIRVPKGFPAEARPISVEELKMLLAGIDFWNAHTSLHYSRTK